jgi:hypothetical protein
MHILFAEPRLGLALGFTSEFLLDSVDGLVQSGGYLVNRKQVNYIVKWYNILQSEMQFQAH